ncbi:MAG TPA: carbonic anhydrase [Clostridiales bacterium]|jgi:carbonic anhydrase|nr:carbonic anhydrase [Clostridiales bacterium]
MELKKRIEKFKTREFETNKEFYLGIEKGQNPHTLFIGCSDSRVNAEILFQARAGELFQIRNVANIVPRDDDPDNNLSVVSALEYAVKVLKVKNIIVCGHSNCGGCAAIRKLNDYKDDLPNTAEWISQSSRISDYIDGKYPDMNEDNKLVLLEKLNAVRQLDNLLTYDFIRQAFDSRKLNLQAYYYDIGTGDISIYDYENEFSDLIKEIALS